MEWLVIIIPLVLFSCFSALLYFYIKRKQRRKEYRVRCVTTSVIDDDVQPNGSEVQFTAGGKNTEWGTEGVCDEML